MRTLLRCLSLSSLFILQVVCLRGDELSDAVQAYSQKVNGIVQSLPSGTSPIVVDYLQTCLASVTRLQGVSPDAGNLSALLKQVADARTAARAKLVDGTSGAPPVRAENEAYNEHLQPLAAENFLSWVALQNDFLSRKYFNTKTSKTGNFIEGYINGQWDLTRADPNLLRQRDGPRPLGVSPWEAVVRFEPTLAMREGGSAAIMGTAGLSHTFFPKIADSTPPRIVEDFASKWVKKSGLRAGVGAARLSDKTRLLLGAGTQINALGVWALYEPKDDIWMLGLSTADLSKLKKALGWFD